MDHAVGLLAERVGRGHPDQIQRHHHLGQEGDRDGASQNCQNWLLRCEVGCRIQADGVKSIRRVPDDLVAVAGTRQSGSNHAISATLEARVGCDR